VISWRRIFFTLSVSLITASRDPFRLLKVKGKDTSINKLYIYQSLRNDFQSVEKGASAGGIFGMLAVRTRRGRVDRSIRNP
jgi:hypothetical protein